MEKWMDIILALAAGIATAVPLIIKLVQYVKMAMREKNWSKLLRLVMAQMELAEETFSTGAKRKAYVMYAVMHLAETVDYKIDEAELSELIERLCAMSKVVNAPEGEI